MYCQNNGICVTVYINLILDISFFLMFDLNIPSSYHSNPFRKEIASDK